MSDTMLNAVIRMPYDMAMASELSRLQFYNRAQSLLDARAADKARIAELEKLIRQVRITLGITAELERKMLSSRAYGSLRDECDRIDAALAQQGKEDEL